MSRSLVGLKTIVGIRPVDPRIDGDGPVVTGTIEADLGGPPEAGVYAVRTEHGLVFRRADELILKPDL